MTWDMCWNCLALELYANFDGVVKIAVGEDRGGGADDLGGGGGDAGGGGGYDGPALG